jgi:hypothetical protein
LAEGWLIALVGALMGLCLIACRSAPVKLYTPEDPAVFHPCAGRHPDISPTARSFAAMLRGLEKYKWTIDKVTPRRGTIRATACLAMTSNCIAFDFHFDSSGQVSMAHAPDTPVIRKMDDHAIRWVRNLSTHFSYDRCLDAELAKATLKKHGVKPEDFAGLGSGGPGIGP